MKYICVYSGSFNDGDVIYSGKTLNEAYARMAEEYGVDITPEECDFYLLGNPLALNITRSRIDIQAAK